MHKALFLSRLSMLLPFSLNHVRECFSSSLFLLELFAELSVCLLSDRPQNSNHCRGQAWNKVHPYQNSGRIFARTRSFPGPQAVRNALHTSQKTKNNTPFDLEGWAMEEIRLALGEYVQTRPGRDRESWISAQISQLCEIFFAAHHTTRHFLIIWNY